MRRLLAVCLFAAACSGAPEDIERICEAATECGAIGSEETAACIMELDAATPDSATRAAAECAACLDTMTCGQIADGDCRSACEPLLDAANASPGTLTGACTSTSRSNYAFRSSSGNLLVALACDGVTIEINAGRHFSVGERFGCGSVTAWQGTETGTCPTALGEISIGERDGRRWVTGSCFCADTQLNFEVPYRISL